MANKKILKNLIDEYKVNISDIGKKTKYAELFCEMCEKNSTHQILKTTKGIFYGCSRCFTVEQLE